MNCKNEGDFFEKKILQVTSLTLIYSFLNFQTLYNSIYLNLNVDFDNPFIRESTSCL